jgi:hypothetical protein
MPRYKAQNIQNQPFKPRYNPLQHQSPLLQQSIVLADHTGMALAWISYPCIIPQSLLFDKQKILKSR